MGSTNMAPDIRLSRVQQGLRESVTYMEFDMGWFMEKWRTVCIATINYFGDLR